MQGRDYWYGKEVEGRLYGLYTLFVRNKFPNEFFTKKINKKVKHIYYTIESWNTDYIDFIESLIEDYPVSIEVDKDTYHRLTPNMKVHCHIIYRIKDFNIFDLKETDSIFIDGNTFNVLCFSKHNAIKVDYKDYQNDTKKCI